MDTIKKIAWVLCILLTVPLMAQEEEAIAWNPGRKLSWEDFRGKPFETAWAAATTASGISYEYSGQATDNGYELHFNVGAYFYPDKSWYQPKLCDHEVLQHEQLHFDISELYARKFRAELAKTRFSKEVKAEVKAIYKKVLQELSAFQSRYDHETNYSRDREKQQAWNEKIASLLAAKSL